MRYNNQELWRTFKRGVPGRKNLKTHDREAYYIMGGCCYCIMVYHARRKVLSRRDVCKLVQLHVNVQIGKIVIKRYFIIEDEEDQAGERSDNSAPCDLPQTHAHVCTFCKLSDLHGCGNYYWLHALLAGLRRSPFILGNAILRTPCGLLLKMLLKNRTWFSTKGPARTRERKSINAMHQSLALKNIQERCSKSQQS